MRSWLYGVFVSVIFISVNARADGIDNITQLKGQDIIWSSPYRSGKEAQLIKVNRIDLGADFVDDGGIIVNGKTYPIDQLFIEKDGKYENLAHLLSYNGVGNTFFVRYYDKDRLSIHQELQKLKSVTASCLGEYNEGGIEGVKKEASQYEACLDAVFERIVGLFYVQSGFGVRQNYEALSAGLKGFYADISNPDYCYGKCGTITQMRMYDKILKRKRDFIFDMLDEIDIQNNDEL